MFCAFCAEAVGMGAAADVGALAKALASFASVPSVASVVKEMADWAPGAAWAKADWRRAR